ncbi:Homeobox protein tgif1 [Sorochytrium milnesiophthora]
MDVVSRKKRANLPKAAIAVMKEWLLENRQNPYPSDSQKAAMALRTNLTVNQINNWRRILPVIMQQSRAHAGHARRKYSSGSFSANTPLTESSTSVSADDATAEVVPAHETAAAPACEPHSPEYSARGSMSSSSSLSSSAQPGLPQPPSSSSTRPPPPPPPPQPQQQLRHSHSDHRGHHQRRTHVPEATGIDARQERRYRPYDVSSSSRHAHAVHGRDRRLSDDKGVVTAPLPVATAPAAEEVDMPRPKQHQHPDARRRSYSLHSLESYGHGLTPAPPAAYPYEHRGYPDQHYYYHHHHSYEQPHHLPPPHMSAPGQAHAAEQHHQHGQQYRHHRGRSSSPPPPPPPPPQQQPSTRARIPSSTSLSALTAVAAVHYDAERASQASKLALQ